MYLSLESWDINGMIVKHIIIPWLIEQWTV